MIEHPIHHNPIKNITKHQGGLLITFYDASSGNHCDKSYCDKCNTCGIQLYSNDYYRITGIYSYCSKECYEKSKLLPLTTFDLIDMTDYGYKFAIFSHNAYDTNKWGGGYGYFWGYRGSENYEKEVQFLERTISRGQQVPGAVWVNYNLLKLGKKWRSDMKKVWEVIVINKEKNEIVCREIVIDGDEKSACSKVSIGFAEKLKDFVFDNLVYIAKELGSY